MMVSRPLRIVAAISIAAVVSLPVFVILYISPSFTRLVADNAREESARVASHLASTLLSGDDILRLRRLPADFSAEADTVRKSFNIMKLRVLMPDGTIVYSADPTERGNRSGVPAAMKTAAGGGIYSTVVLNVAKTVEGRTSRVDVAETKVPVMKDGKLAAVFDISFDISERMEKLTRIMVRSYLLLFVIVSSLLAATMIGLRRAGKSLAERDAARREWERTFNAVTDPIMILDNDCRIRRVNKAVADLLGVSPEQAIDRFCYQQMHGTATPIRDCPYTKMLADGQVHTEEIFIEKTGRYFAVTVYPITDSRGVRTATAHYAKDITERKKAVDDLKAAEAKYRIVADNTYAWEFWLNPENEYVYSSPSCERITGYLPHEFTDDAGLFLRLVHPDDRELVTAHQNRSLRSVSGGKLQFRIIRRDRTVRWIEQVCQPIFDSAGSYLGSRGSNSDITEQKEMDEAFRKNAYNLAEAQRIAHIGSWELNLEHNRLHWSDEVFHIFEIESSGFDGSYEAFLDLVHPDDRSTVDAEYTRSLDNKTPFDLTHRLLMKDGRVKYVHDRCETAYDGDGRPLRSLGTIQDITERRQAEAALRENEKFLRAVIDTEPECVKLVSRDGLLLSMNPAGLAMLDADSLDTIKGQPVNALVSPEYRVAFRKLVDDVFQGQAARLEFRVNSLRGNSLWMDSHSVPLRNERDEIVAMLSITRDVTKRKQMEEELMQHLKSMTALNEIGIAISSSLDMRVTLAMLVERLISQLKVDAANVLLLDQDTLFLTCASSIGFKTSAINKTRIRIGTGNAGRAALERRPVVVPDVGTTLTRSLEGEDFRAHIAVPLIAKGRVMGVLEIFHRQRLDPGTDWTSFLETMAAQAAIAIDNATMFDTMQRTNTELVLSYDATLAGWGRTLEFRDEDTSGHTERVAGITVDFARRMGIPERELVNIRRGALLHDIGKIGIPDTILRKPGLLSPEERQIMERHPTYAFELLHPIPFLHRALDIPYCHHEKWDGSGYPRGLAGEQIPFAARLFSVVDVWDALRTDRPYRSAWPVEKVREHLRTLAGSAFDPAVVEGFLAMIDEEAEIPTDKNAVQPAPLQVPPRFERGASEAPRSAARPK